MTIKKFIICGLKLLVFIFSAIKGFGIPDWDISLLGIGAHRNFFFHSVILMGLLFIGLRLLSRKFTVYPLKNLVETLTGLVIAGASLGLGIHLTIDGVFQGSKAVLFPLIGSLINDTTLDDRLWLIINGVVSFFLCWFLVQQVFEPNERSILLKYLTEAGKCLRSLFARSSIENKITMEEIEGKLGRAVIKDENLKQYNEIQVKVDSAKDHRDNNLFNITLFGQVNVGKTSIIRSIIAEYSGTISARAGETQRVCTVEWKDADINHFKLQFIDTQGFTEVGGFDQEKAACDAAAVSDLILFVIDSDLKESELKLLKRLFTEAKRIIVVLNKCDLYSQEQIEEIRHSVLEKLDGYLPPNHFIAVCAESRDVDVEIIGKTEGEIRHEKRTIPANLVHLSNRITEIVRKDGCALHKDAQNALENQVRTQFSMVGMTPVVQEKIKTLIDHQKSIIFESGTEQPGELRDILNRININDFIRDLAAAMDVTYTARSFALYEDCIRAIESEIKNGNNPQYSKLQKPAFAASKVVELTGKSAVTFLLAKTRVRSPDAFIKDVLKEVFF